MLYHAFLRQAFGAYLPLEPAELALILPCFTLRRVAKNDFLLTSGNVCDFWGFVGHGLLRVYSTTEKGEDYTGWFVKEGDFLTEYASFHYQRPSLENIIALEDTELLVVNYAQLQDLYAQFPAFDRLCRRLYEKQMADIKQRILFRVRHPARVRYQQLLTQHPALVQRVPLKFLASYLGITDSTLSRIRRAAT